MMYSYICPLLPLVLSTSGFIMARRPSFSYAPLVLASSFVVPAVRRRRSHTSHMTSSSTIYFPRNNEISQAGGSDSAAGGGGASSAAADAGEGVGWLGYIKSVLAS